MVNCTGSLLIISVMVKSTQSGIQLYDHVDEVAKKKILIILYEYPRHLMFLS